MLLKSIKKIGRSLRTRIIISVLIMLLPSAVLMFSSYHSIKGSIDSLTDIVDEPLSKLVSAKKIQSKILRTELPFHLFLNRGETADRDNFIRLSVDIDILFENINKIEHLSAEDKTLLKSAQSEWQSAKNLGENLLTTTNIPSNDILIDKVDQFGRHLERAASILDEISEVSLDQIKDLRFIAQDNEWKSIGGLMIVFGLGTLLAILAALSLGQSVITPIRRLERTVSQFGQGNTSSRIRLRSNDELGSLAKAFNLLAERYEFIKRELEQLSTQDALTGLHDRSKLHEETLLEIERAKRYDRTFSLLLINIANRDEINQQYGHLVGDSVMCSVANTLRNTIRPTDLATRYNKDEFAIILSETNQKGAIETTQRIFDAIENQPLNIGDGNVLSISINIGYATYPTNADNDSSLFSLIENTCSRAAFDKKSQKLMMDASNT